MPAEMICLYIGSLMILAIMMLGVVRARANAPDAASLAALKSITTMWLTMAVTLFFGAAGCVLLYLYPALVSETLLKLTPS